MKLQLFNLVILSMSLVGLYSPANASIGSESHLNFETLETNRSEMNKAFLVYNNEGENCVISLNEQTSKILNTNDLLEKMENSSLENAFVFKSNEDLKACQPEIAQLVLDSIGKNQVAGLPAIVLGAVAVASYVVACKTANHVYYTEKLKNSPDRVVTAMLCWPVYAIDDLLPSMLDSDPPN